MFPNKIYLNGFYISNSIAPISPICSTIFFMKDLFIPLFRPADFLGNKKSSFNEHAHTHNRLRNTRLTSQKYALNFVCSSPIALRKNQQKWPLFTKVLLKYHSVWSANTTVEIIDLSTTTKKIHKRSGDGKQIAANLVLFLFLNSGIWFQTELMGEILHIHQNISACSNSHLAPICFISHYFSPWANLPIGLLNTDKNLVIIGLHIMPMFIY